MEEHWWEGVRRQVEHDDPTLLSISVLYMDMDIWPQIAYCYTLYRLRLWRIWSEYRIKYKSKGNHNFTWSCPSTLGRILRAVSSGSMLE